MNTPSPSGAWLNRNFFLLWQGQLASQVGSQVFLIALVLWLKETTGSATMLGLMMTVATLPGVLLGPLGGAIVDRYSRRRLLVGGDLLRGVAFIALGTLMFLRPQDPHLVVGALFAVALLGGVVTAVFQPAGLSLIPDLVDKERVASANALVQASFQGVVLLAQGAAGVLFRLVGAPLLALFDGLSFLYSALSTAFVRVPERPARAHGPLRHTLRALLADTAGGFRYVSAHQGMRLLFAVAALLKFFLVPFALLFPFYVESQLRAGAEWYGFLLAGSGLGAFVGYLAAGALRAGGAARSRLVTGSLLATALGLSGLGLAHSPWVALALVCGVGLLNGLINVNLMTILQLTTPVEMRGRVFGVLRTLTEGLVPVSLTLVGVMTDLVQRNVPLVYLSCGGALALISVGVALSGECQRFLAGEAAPRLTAPAPA